MKRLLVLTGFIALSSCTSKEDAIKERDEKITKAIQTAIEHKLDKDRLEKIQDFKLLSVDSVTERQYIMLCADKFRFFLSSAQSAYEALNNGIILTDTVLATDETINQTRAEYAGEIATAKKQLDSCEHAAQNASTSFYGFFVKAFFIRTDKATEDTVAGNRYLVTHDMKVQVYIADKYE